jgi:transcriptional regulator
MIAINLEISWIYSDFALGNLSMSGKIAQADPAGDAQGQGTYILPMYQPPAFREERLNVLHALIREHPLALLITSGAAGLEANPVPFLVDAGDGPQGTLRAHLARANPQLRALAEGGEALAVFQAANAYVSPGWYASKREHGRVVPTWNYAVVQVRGTPRVIDEAPWLRALVGRLTERHEAGRAHPWSVQDAPEDFVVAQLKGIVGVEIPIARIDGKFKLSQNRPEPDRAGVAAGLAAEPDAQSRAIAEMMLTRA